MLALSIPVDSFWNITATLDLGSGLIVIVHADVTNGLLVCPLYAYKHTSRVTVVPAACSPVVKSKVCATATL